MAAAIELARATGLHEKRRSSSSTATEHATSSTSRFSLCCSDLEKIVALLLWMAHDYQSDIHIDDIHEAALAAVLKHLDACGGIQAYSWRSRISLHAASIAKLSELIDIMMLFEDGSPKDANETLAFMRRVATFRDEVLVTWSDTATERFELGKAATSLCYRRFGRIWLTDELQPHQKQDKKYRLRNSFEGDTHLTVFQKSVTDNVIRKFLGDKRVAFFIWQHGIPSIADLQLVYRRRLDSQYRVVDLGMLQSILNECLQWYICLAKDIVVGEFLDEQKRQKQKTRWEALNKARDALWLGADLAKERDHGKRSHGDMDHDQREIPTKKRFR